MRKLSITLALAAATLAGALVPAAADAAKAKTRYYVSVGDSLAVGYQQDSDGDPVFRPGYTSAVLKQARKKKVNRKLRLVNFGCPGEDTTTFLASGCRLPVKPADRTAQVGRVLKFLKAHKKRIAFVTISLGANNVLPCAAGGAIDLDCLSKGIGRMKVDLPIIYRAIRARLRPGVKVATLVPYNPFLALYLRGGDYQKLALTSNSLGRSVRLAIATAAQARQVRVVDGLLAFDAFNEATTDLGGQQVPVGVANVCLLTQQCLPPPQGNIHPTDAGYARLGEAFNTALGF